MKSILSILVLFISASLFSQEHVNLKKGFAAQGYDVVAYFSNNALKGDAKYQTTYEGVKYKFANQKHLSTFNKNPESFVPQYGGFCAYAIAIKNEEVGVNPETFQIVDGKLYLFYNRWGVNTLEKWNETDAVSLQKTADANWKNIVKKKS